MTGPNDNPYSRPAPEDSSNDLLRPLEQCCLMTVSTVLLILLTGWMFASWLGGVSYVDRADATWKQHHLIVAINRAGSAELSLLPRIGPTLADRIIRSRDVDGPFRSIDDLQRVRGIGPITAARLEPWVSFDDFAERDGHRG